MPELCAYGPCKCIVPDGEMFCGEICVMLGAQLVRNVTVVSAVPLKDEGDIVPRCPCGHDGCGDSLVSGRIN